jgi:hypothetical protein
MDRNHYTDLNIDNACSRPLSDAAVLMRPQDVMGHSQLTRPQKREILASWASDTRAVHSQPTLRQLDNGAIVQVADVLRALRALDDNAEFDPHASDLLRPLAQHQHRRSLPLLKIALRRWSRDDDDDDDPPPCPANIAKLPPTPLSGGDIVNPMLAMAA